MVRLGAWLDQVPDDADIPAATGTSTRTTSSKKQTLAADTWRKRFAAVAFSVPQQRPRLRPHPQWHDLTGGKWVWGGRARRADLTDCTFWGSDCYDPNGKPDRHCSSPSSTTRANTACRSSSARPPPRRTPASHLGDRGPRMVRRARNRGPLVASAVRRKPDYRMSAETQRAWPPRLSSDNSDDNCGCGNLFIVNPPLRPHGRGGGVPLLGRALGPARRSELDAEALPSRTLARRASSPTPAPPAWTPRRPTSTGSRRCSWRCASALKEDAHGGIVAQTPARGADSGHGSVTARW